MKELIDLNISLISDSKKHGDEIADFFGVKHYEFPADYFNMALNTITMTVELLDYYRSIWESASVHGYTSEEIDLIREENGQRVNQIQKMCFISLMSSFEFVAKNIVMRNEDVFGTFNGRIYLSGIMKRSESKALLTKEDLNLWNGMITLRNILVHNNGISDVNEEYNYPDVTVVLIDGCMTKGNLRSFPLLSKWILINARSWLENISQQLKLI
ncbi:hypothetical protein [Aeromonas dhakensis]|uniref:hypothetical protein n=1 Tax=Aeromonas dhakensis TaxID=196024 RepID=UPI003BA33789